MLQKLEEIRDYLFKYVEVNIDLFKTETQEKIEDLTIQIVYLMIMLSLMTGAAIMLLMVFAAFLNEWLESRYSGFLIVFAIFTISLLAWITQSKTIKNIIRLMLHKAFNPKK